MKTTRGANVLNFVIFMTHVIWSSNLQFWQFCLKWKNAAEGSLKTDFLHDTRVSTFFVCLWKWPEATGKKPSLRSFLTADFVVFLRRCERDFYEKKEQIFAREQFRRMDKGQRYQWTQKKIFFCEVQIWFWIFCMPEWPKAAEKVRFFVFCSRFKEQILFGSSGLVIFASEVDVVGCKKKKKVAGSRFFRFFWTWKRVPSVMGGKWSTLLPKGVLNSVRIVVWGKTVHLASRSVVEVRQVRRVLWNIFLKEHCSGKTFCLSWRVCLSKTPGKKHFCECR